MSIPIGATPILTGKEAEDFLKTISEDLKHPVGLVPTPKLEEARKLIEKYGREHERNRTVKRDIQAGKRGQ